MKNGHQSECAYNSKRARYRYRYAVGRKGIANRSIGKGHAWGGKGVVPCFRPVDSTLTFPLGLGKKDRWTGHTHQKPVKLSARYNGPNRAGLLL